MPVVPRGERSFFGPGMIGQALAHAGGLVPTVERLGALGAGGGDPTASASGLHATATLTLNGGGGGVFTWTPGVGRTVHATARVVVGGLPGSGAELWVSLTNDNSNGYQFSKQNPGQTGVAGLDVWVGSGRSQFTFTISCPDGAGCDADALFLATVE